MSARSVITTIRQDLEAHVGNKIKLKANRGRKKIIEREGVLESTYPHVFVVKISERENQERRVSYSYTDVLTSTVELTLCGNDGDTKLECKA